VREAVAAGQDTDAPRRAELLAEIRKAQEKRAEARRDWAEDIIDKEDWLDIRQRTDNRINRARKEYDQLTGTATVFGDIPPGRGPRRMAGLEHRPAPPRRQGRPQPDHHQPGHPRAPGNTEPRTAGRRPSPADGIRLAALIEFVRPLPMMHRQGTHVIYQGE